jgi:release factor glutamine methyltransferase
MSAPTGTTVGEILSANLLYHASLKQEIEWLFLETLGWSRHQLITDLDYVLAPGERDQILSRLERLVKGEPLAYILGHQDFYKYRFIVSSAVLIPRADTELVVETALDYLRGRRIEGTEIQLADLGTGSGCIGLSLLMDLPKSRLWACDVSLAALEVFRKNAKALGLEGRVLDSNSDVSGNLFENIYDTIVSNPPYIARGDERLQDSVRQFEPALALFADHDGLSFYEAWIPWSFKALRESGAIVFEFGEGQGEAVLKIAQLAGFKKWTLKKDLSGKDRVLLAIKE